MVGTVDLTIKLSAAPGAGESVTVNYSTSDGTAVGSSDGAGADFTSMTSTPIVFDSGETSKSISISITDDTINEVAETFTIVPMTSTTGITTHAGTVTINDNDTTLPKLDLAALSGPISEATSTTSNTTQNVTVNLTDSSGSTYSAGREITVHYLLTGIEANVPIDVKLASDAPGRSSDSRGILTIAKGASSAMIPIEIIADQYDEIDETFTITLTNASDATIGTNSITATIRDDDDEPKVSIEFSETVHETDADFTDTIAVTLDTASGQTVVVPYRVEIDSAGLDDFSLAKWGTDLYSR